MRSGQEGASDATDEKCSFTQVHGICSMEKTLLVSDVATGCIKLASGLSNTQTDESSYHDKFKLTNFRPSFRKHKTTKLDIYIP